MPSLHGRASLPACSRIGARTHSRAPCPAHALARPCTHAFTLHHHHHRRPRPLLRADFEYEVAWQGLSSLKFNRWLPRAELEEKGFRKFVAEFDQRLASAALGNDARPLTKDNITKFLQDFGLEPEFGVHSNIRGLSGAARLGQRAVCCARARGWASLRACIASGIA